MFTDRSCHSTTYGPYGLLPTNKPNAACMCASGAPSFACELRWTLEMVIDVEVMVVCLRPATAVVPTLACNIFQ